MRVLILGATGFVGSRLFASLSTRHEVHSFSPRISEIDALENYIETNQFDVIIHLVSSLIPSSTSDDFYKSFNEILLPTYKVIDIASKLKIKFVFISSGGTIYGENALTSKFEEFETAKPKNYYGLSKQLIEEYIFFKNRSDALHYLVLRPSNVYGEGQLFNKSQGFIAVAIDRILNGKAIHIWGDGNNFRNYLYIGDFVSIVEELLKTEVVNQTINLAGPDSVSLLDVLEVIHKETGISPQINFELSKKFDVSRIDLSVVKLNSLISFTYTPLQQGIKNQIEYYRRNFLK